MANFDTLLSQIHGNIINGTVTGPVVEEADTYITIDNNRKFILPEDFNTTIAYEGDVNSQIVTFKCPKTYEGHDLSKCENKRLRWVNIKGGREGSSVLRWQANDDSTFLLKWEAPAEAFGCAGQLNVSITLSDYIDGKLAFSWNTAALKSLQVGETLDKVSEKINEENFLDYVPAKDEILTIDTETRKINAPDNYSHTFCNYGDVNTSVVYFQIKRYVRGIDVLADDTLINVYWKIQDVSNIDKGYNSIDNKRLKVVELEDRDSEGTVIIAWTPSPNVTVNSLFYAGAITIQLEISSADGRVWRTNTYSNLKIGSNIFPTSLTEIPGDIETNINYIIDGAKITHDQNAEVIAGLVKLRKCTKSAPIMVYKNEIVVEYDDNGNYVGAKIGTVQDAQDSRQAPYVAYAPSTIITLYGGNSSEE